MPRLKRRRVPCTSEEEDRLTERARATVTKRYPRGMPVAVFIREMALEAPLAPHMRPKEPTGVEAPSSQVEAVPPQPGEADAKRADEER